MFLYSCQLFLLRATIDVSVEVFKEQLSSFNPSQDSFWQPVTLLYVNYVSLLQ